MRTIVVAATCALALGACSSNSGQDAASPASPVPSVSPTGPAVLTTEQAGQRYLKYICRSNEALERLNNSGFDQIYIGETLSPDEVAALKNLARVDQKSARALQDPDYVWPDAVQKPVERVAVQLYEQSAEALDIAKSGEASALDSGTGGSATLVRLKLDLPPRGKGCGKQ